MERLDRDAAAVIVIDLQNDFCDPDGYQSRLGRDVAHTHEAASAIVSFTEQARHLGVPIFLLRNVHDPATETEEWHARHLEPRPGSSCAPGSWGAEFFRIEPAKSDRVVVKSRYSAFAKTSLERMLRELDRRALFFCGITTSVCVETSLRDAVCRDFVATLVNDCCADYSPAAHDGAVRAVSHGFGAVLNSDAVLAAWR